MNKIMIFENEEFGKVRSTVINGEPWFVGKDIAKILGYRDTSDALKKHVDAEDKLSRYFADSGQNRLMYVINESGFYSLVLSSKLPTAKKVKRWVTSEVLPTIRKSGGFVNNPQKFVDTYFPSADSYTKDFILALLEHNDELESKLELNAPKVSFAEHVEDSDDYININTLAKLSNANGIKMGSTKLFEWLRNNNILMKNNLPYQKFMKRGYFVVKESIKRVSGKYKLFQTTLVTGKGQVYLINKLLNDKSLEVNKNA